MATDDNLTIFFFAVGYFAYIETSAPRQSGDKARLLSPPVTGTGIKCLIFWYYMYGPNVQTLNMYVVGDSNLGQPVWTRTGTLGSNWINAAVDVNIGNTQKEFQVRINMKEKVMQKRKMNTEV